MTDQEALKIAMALMNSVSQEERTQLISNTPHVNDRITALAVAAFFLVSDPNALRTVIDTAYCIGVRAGKMAAS